MESVEILTTLRPQQAGNLGEGLPPPDMRKDEICQMFRKFQEWMETAVASLAKQAARRISALINDSDGTNEESEGLAQMFFTHVQLVRVDRDLGNEDRDIVANCLDLEATCRPMHGTGVSDTALCCATTAQTTATTETSVMTTCYDRLFLNVPVVKWDGLIMQFDTHEGIDDATIIVKGLRLSSRSLVVAGTKKVIDMNP